MVFIDFDKSRTKYAWRILESDRYIFHIEPSNMKDCDLEPVLMDADNRYGQITGLLEIDKSAKKEGERLFKYNCWIHSGEIVPADEVRPESENRFRGMGSAGVKGIDYVIYNDSWINHKRRLLHEEAHLIWMNEVGEAPSILNEGIAIYTEDVLSDGREAFRNKLVRAWNESVGREKNLLIKLMNNRCFWMNFGKLPVYTIGAALVSHIINHNGIDTLKKVFLNTHFTTRA
jgi:hypothetical protein